MEAKDTRVVIDITRLNAELKTTVEKIDQLRAEIDAIVAEIEGTAVGNSVVANDATTVND